jgi:surface antigen
MNKLVNLMIVGSLAFGLAACETTNENLGTMTGGVIGGLVGSQFGGGTGRVAAAAGGTLIGAMIGGAMGRGMDQQDRMNMNQALEVSPTGHAVTWVNPDTHNQYTVTPTRTVKVASGQPCREFTTTALIGGRTQQIYGKACRDASGAWKVVNT